MSGPVSGAATSRYPVSVEPWRAKPDAGGRRRFAARACPASRRRRCRRSRRRRAGRRSPSVFIRSRRSSILPPRPLSPAISATSKPRPRRSPPILKRSRVGQHVARCTARMPSKRTDQSVGEAAIRRSPDSCVSRKSARRGSSTRSVACKPAPNASRPLRSCRFAEYCVAAVAAPAERAVRRR